jgi:hypothetical protein
VELPISIFYTPRIFFMPLAGVVSKTRVHHVLAICGCREDLGAKESFDKGDFSSGGGS